MNIATAFPSKFLKAAELEGDVNYTIARVEIETVGQGKDAEEKPIVYFEETDKGLALNRTNANAISQLHGPDTDNWVGKMVTLFATEVDFKGTPTLAVRIRLRAPKKTTAAQPATATAPAAAQAGRAAAIAAFATKTPSWDRAKRNTKWMEAFSSVYVGRTMDSMTDAEWQTFAKQITDDYDEALGDFLAF